MAHAIYVDLIAGRATETIATIYYGSHNGSIRKSYRFAPRGCSKSSPLYPHFYRCDVVLRQSAFYNFVCHHDYVFTHLARSERSIRTQKGSRPLKRTERYAAITLPVKFRKTTGILCGFLLYLRAGHLVDLFQTGSNRLYRSWRGFDFCWRPCACSSSLASAKFALSGHKFAARFRPLSVLHSGWAILFNIGICPPLLVVLHQSHRPSHSNL